MSRPADMTPSAGPAPRPCRAQQQVHPAGRGPRPGGPHARSPHARSPHARRPGGRPGLEQAALSFAEHPPCRNASPRPHAAGRREGTRRGLSPSSGEKRGQREGQGRGEDGAGRGGSRPDTVTRSRRAPPAPGPAAAPRGLPSASRAERGSATPARAPRIRQV